MKYASSLALGFIYRPFFLHQSIKEQDASYNPPKESAVTSNRVVRRATIPGGHRLPLALCIGPDLPSRGRQHTSIGYATARAALSSFLPSGGRFLGLPLLPPTEGYRVRAVVVGRANRRLEAQSLPPHEVLSNGASSLKPAKLHPGSSTSNGRPIPINRQIDNMTRIPRERRGADPGVFLGSQRSQPHCAGETRSRTAMIKTLKERSSVTGSPGNTCPARRPRGSQGGLWPRRPGSSQPNHWRGNRKPSNDGFDLSQRADHKSA